MGSKQASIFGGCIEARLKSAKREQKKIASKDLSEKIKTLYRMYEKLYEKQEIYLEARDCIVKNNIVIYPEDRQAEPISIINLTINEIDTRIEQMAKALQE